MKTATKKRSVKQSASRLALFETSKDALNATLIVSLLANLFVLCIWVVLNTTSKYDQALYNFFITR